MFSTSSQEPSRFNCPNLKWMICCGSVDIDSDGDVSAATAIVCDVTLGVDVLEIGASMLKCWRQTEQNKVFFEQNEIAWGHPALETEIVEGSVPMKTLIVGNGLKIPNDLWVWLAWVRTSVPL